jgi:hypothetical protein
MNTKTKTTTALASLMETSHERPWGEASPRRGKANLQLALSFVAAFPVASKLTAAEFDQWAAKEGLLVIPPADSSTDSDAWKAHLHRRHELRYRINKAGAHPRLADEGSTPFTMDTVSPSFYEVRSPHAAYAQSSMAMKIMSTTVTQKTKLAYLMQSADWGSLPAYEQVFAEEIYSDIDGLAEDTITRAGRINKKMEGLKKRLELSVGTGEIKPQNGGIRQLLSPVGDSPEIDETG